MDLLVAGALVLTLIITVFAFTRGRPAPPAAPKQPPPQPKDLGR